MALAQLGHAPDDARAVARARVAVAAEQRADRGDELLEQQARVGLVVRRVERGLEHKVGDVVLRVIDEEAARAR